MQKVYYDATANKEVVDVSGAKDEAQVKAEFGLGNSTQIVEIDESFEATEVVNGTLQKFDAKQRGIDQAAAKSAADQAKKTAALAKLNAGRAPGQELTEDDLNDLGL
jgi:spermidine/putrescine-binding protein